MITDRRLMTPITVTLDGARIDMDWEPVLVREFNNWRADRQRFSRPDAIREMIRWAAAHDTTGRQRPVQPSDPVLVQLDAYRDAHVLLARTEAVKLAIFTVLRQPWPVGNARPERKRQRSAPPEPKPPDIRLVVDNEERRDALPYSKTGW